LIETHELEQLLKEEPERVTVFNASYPTATAKPRENHVSKRIPGSVFFDFDEFSQKGTQLSYMVPTIEHFTGHMQKLDVRKNDIVVVYDKVGMLSSPRAFWLLKLFGLPQVHLLNGTFSKWEAENRQTFSGETPCAWSRINRKTPTKADDFSFAFNKQNVRLYDDIVNITSRAKQNGGITLLDSRFEHVYKAGNIPTSVNVPFT
jgi:thiosulfate/3-mercaptopyruvate sulfurtransferase